MQILIFRKGFEAFEKEWKHSNANLNYLKGIQTIQMHIRTILKDSNHSKRIRSFRNKIRTIRKVFEAFECTFESFERD